MASIDIVGGSVVWSFEAQSRAFDRQVDASTAKVEAFEAKLKKAESGPLSSFAGGLLSTGRRVSSFGDKVIAAGAATSTLGSTITRNTLPATLALGGGIGFISKMAFDQVRSVENARATMIGYGASVEEADEAMREAVKFVRSPKGKLFQREDILNTQAGLFGIGIEAKNLTKGAKTLAKATVAGNRSFEELVEVVRAVNAEGKLGIVRFQQLASAGVFLDESLIGTSMSAQTLLEHMEGALPDKLIENRARTIDGILITVQSSFRDLGSAILGVDKETSQFIQGGAGDRLVKLLQEIPKILEKEEVKEAFEDMGKAIADFAEKALPRIIDFFTFVGRNIDTISKMTAGLLAFGIAIKVVGATMTGVGAAIKLFGFLISGAGMAVRGFAASLTFLMAHPLILAAAGVTALATAAALLTKELTVAKATGQQLSGSMSLLSNVFKVAYPPLSLFTQGASSLSAVLFGNKIRSDELKGAQERLKRAQEELKTATDNLKNANLDLEGSNLGVERAERNLTQAIEQFGRESLEAREAAHNLEQAKQRQKEATDRARDATEKENGAQRNVADALENTKRKVDDQAGAWERLTDKIGGVLRSAAEGKRSVLNPLGIKIPGFAEGVRNFRGGLAVVGERGPELVNLPKGADVFPDIQSLPAMAPSATPSPAPPISITINMSGIMTRSRSDEREIGKSLIESINEELRANNMDEIGGGTLTGFNVRRAP